MLSNDNSNMAFNDFENMPYIPYAIVEDILTDTSTNCENLWKLLKYNTLRPLEMNNLTLKEKREMIWRGEEEQNKYSVFFKPLISDSMTDSEQMTQMRIYRIVTEPTNQYSSLVLIKIELITNETTCLVRTNGKIVERTDLLESYLLNYLNGRDISLGSGILTFDRTMSRSCNSQLNISNSKSFFGRTITLALRYSNAKTGGAC